MKVFLGQYDLIGSEFHFSCSANLKYFVGKMFVFPRSQIIKGVHRELCLHALFKLKVSIFENMQHIFGGLVSIGTHKPDFVEDYYFERYSGQSSHKEVMNT